MSNLYGVIAHGAIPAASVHRGVAMVPTSADAVVVDASFAVKWVLDEPDADKARFMLRRWQQAGTRILAPALLFIEAASIVYKRVRKGELTAQDAQAVHTALLALEIAYDADPALSTVAVEAAAQWHLASAYDGHYLALAENETCDLWTADKRLINTLQGKHPLARWIGDIDTSATSGGP